MAESVAEFFRANFQAHCHERAYRQRRGYRTEWFTYGQVMEMVLRFCGELEARGIGRGARVLLGGGNGAEGVGVVFGCAMWGGVVGPVGGVAGGGVAARGAGQGGGQLGGVSARK